MRTDFSFGTEYIHINRSQISITSQPPFQSPKPSMGHPTQEFPGSLPAGPNYRRPRISRVPVLASGQGSRNSTTFFQEGQTKNSCLGQNVVSPTLVPPAFPTQPSQSFSRARQSPIPTPPENKDVVSLTPCSKALASS